MAHTFAGIFPREIKSQGNLSGRTRALMKEISSITSSKERENSFGKITAHTKARGRIT